MNRAMCHFTVNEHLRDALPLFRTLARVGIQSSFHRSSLLRVRDRLFAFVHNFNPAGSDAYFEEEYEAFVDALALATMALKRAYDDPMQIVFLRAAVQSLERVEAQTIGA